MNQGFAGLDVAALGTQLQQLEKIVLLWTRFCDFEQVEQRVRLLRDETQAALNAMEKAAKAEQSLAAVQERQERAAAELQAKVQDLETRELRLQERAAAISEREQKWAAVTARVRGVAA
jgi:hypothetical protein